MAKKSKPPRHQRILNPPLKKKFCELYAKCRSMEAAARAIGVHPRTVRNERDRDPEFAEQIKNARSEIYVVAAAALLEKDPKHWLACSDPKRWSLKQVHEHSGPEGKPIETKSTIDLSKLSDDDLRKLEAIIASATTEPGPDQG